MPLPQFHPAVQAWFANTFPDGATRAQLDAWPAIGSGRHALIAAPTGLGQDAGGVSGRHRHAGARGCRGRPAGCDARGVRVAVEGAVQRHPAQPRSAARGDFRRAHQGGIARAGNPRAGAHRRHLAERARGHAQAAAAHPRDDAGVAVPAAHQRFGPRDAGHRAHGDRRRNPRRRADQARRAPVADPGAAGRQCGAAHAACRLVGDAEADRRSRAFPGG